jgi:UDPglucose 6-dehydrogenase
MKIGIIGQGFVGTAIRTFLEEWCDHSITTYDIKDDIPFDIGYHNVVRNSEMIYLCLPTPMDKEGRCHLDIVTDALRLLNNCASAANKMPLVLIKSTMVPGTSERLQSLFNSLILVTNPEFLTERNAYEDFKNSDRHVLGIANPHNNPQVRTVLKDYHKNLWTQAECIFVSPIEAELIKYITNSYFSVKVTFANHMYQLCQELGVDYSKFIKSAVIADRRIEPTHWEVPGPDGKLGFGGSCFPKDLSGMITLFKDNGVDAALLETAREYNNKVRPEKDWEDLVGRAVVAMKKNVSEEKECQL